MTLQRSKPSIYRYIAQIDWLFLSGQILSGLTFLATHIGLLTVSAIATSTKLAPPFLFLKFSAAT